MAEGKLNMVRAPVAPSPLSVSVQSSSGKMLSVMDLFTEERPEWTVEEAAQTLRLSQSTVYRYFRTLAEVGIVFSLRPAHYLLGPGIVHYGRQLRMSDPLICAARPVLERLGESLDQTGALFIARLHRNHVMSMFEYSLGGTPFANAYDPGKFMPVADSAPALAILAFMAPRALRKEVGASLEKTPDGVGRWSRLKKDLHPIRTAGFSALPDPEGSLTTYVSVPQRRPDGNVAGSLNLGLPSQACPGAEAGKLALVLAQAASEIGAGVPGGRATDQD